jgi:hypothetical protein
MQPLQSVLLAALLQSVMYAAQPAPLNLKWTELQAASYGQKVIVDLKDGSHINAIVTSVEPSALAVQVTSRSHRTYKKGQASIPREGIAGLRLIRMRVRGRVIGTSVGGVLGLAGGGAVVVIASDPCLLFCFEPRHPNRLGEAGGVAIIAALPVAGYFIGKHADRQEVAITILPD